MMHHQVLKGLLIALHLVLVANAIGIDGKLEFGGSHSSTSSFRSENRETKNAPIKFSRTITASSDDFEDIGVVCTAGGCNTTETNTNTNSGNTIQADVLVHVQTKVDFHHNKTDTIDDTPDIPIVVGYGGSQLDATADDDSSRSLGPQSIFVPDMSEGPSYKSIFGSSSFGSTFNPSGSLTPPTGINIDSMSTPFGGFDPLAKPDPFYATNPSLVPPIGSRIDTFGSSFDPSKPSTGFFVTKSPVASRVDYISKSFEKLDPAAKAGFFSSRNDPQVNINIKPISSVSISTSDDKGVTYKENGIEIKIPYFDPSYHNHYYGENPPPQYIWHSKKINGFNPVEFKTVKSTWTPSLWNRKITPHGHGTTIGEGEVKCTCKEEHHGSGNGLRWYPNTGRTVPSINDPGSQINDKLAPLN